MHVLFAGERVFPDDLIPAPDVTDAEDIEDHPIVSLEALIRMKLNSFHIKDHMHLRDMLDVGLLDETWPQRLSPELGQRLQELIDDPHG